MMKFSLTAVVFLIVLVAPNVLGDDGFMDLIGPQDMAHIQKFATLLKDKGKDLLPADVLKDTFGKAINESIKCFKKDLMELSPKVEEIGKEVAQTINDTSSEPPKEGQDPPTARQGETTDPQPNLAKIDDVMQQLPKPATQFFQNFSKALKKPEIEKALHEVRDKVMNGFNIAKDCFLKELKDGLSPEQFEKLKELWNESNEGAK